MSSGATSQASDQSHDNPPFAAWVAFLRAELDRLIPALTPSARDRCARFSAEATRLERAFSE
jgi:hypothetical protein